MLMGQTDARTPDRYITLSARRGQRVKSSRKYLKYIPNLVHSAVETNVKYTKMTVTESYIISNNIQKT